MAVGIFPSSNETSFQHLIIWASILIKIWNLIFSIRIISQFSALWPNPMKRGNFALMPAAMTAISSGILLHWILVVEFILLTANALFSFEFIEKC